MAMRQALTAFLKNASFFVFCDIGGGGGGSGEGKGGRKGWKEGKVLIYSSTLNVWESADIIQQLK